MGIPGSTLDERVHFVGEVVCMPLSLLINFALFQYLVGIYHRRRREPRVVLLLLCGFIGFAAIIPFSHPDRLVGQRLEAISEMSSAMTFLLQITILGRDINRKLRIRSLVFMTWMSEALIILTTAFVFMSLLEVVIPGFEIGFCDDYIHPVEDIALGFILIFRFGFVVISQNLSALVRTKKLELVLYGLFATHEYPFLWIESSTYPTSWLPVQGLWNRVTILMCLLQTIKEKVRSARSRTQRSSLGSGGPSMKNLAALQNDSMNTFMSSAKQVLRSPTNITRQNTNSVSSSRPNWALSRVLLRRGIRPMPQVGPMLESPTG